MGGPQGGRNQPGLRVRPSSDEPFPSSGRGCRAASERAAGAGPHRQDWGRQCWPNMDLAETHTTTCGPERQHVSVPRAAQGGPQGRGPQPRADPLSPDIDRLTCQRPCGPSDVSVRQRRRHARLQGSALDRPRGGQASAARGLPGTSTAQPLGCRGSQGPRRLEREGQVSPAAQYRPHIWGGAGVAVGESDALLEAP